MKCVICNGSDVCHAEVVEELRVEDDIVQVKIFTPTCTSCGERYYDRRTLRHLERLEAEIRSGKTELRQVGRVLTAG